MDMPGVRPNPDGVEAILSWEDFKTDTKLETDGLLRFRELPLEFVKGYANQMNSLQQLMRNKGKKFEWNEKA